MEDETHVKLHIWDTGGSERFRSMVSLYYRDAAAAIICYDCTQDKTFRSGGFWINEMINNTDQEEFVMALASNKCDISDDLKEVTTEMAEELTKKYDMVYQETSAKTGEGIEILF